MYIYIFIYFNYFLLITKYFLSTYKYLERSFALQSTIISPIECTRKLMPKMLNCNTILVYEPLLVHNGIITFKFNNIAIGL